MSSPSRAVGCRADALSLRLGIESDGRRMLGSSSLAVRVLPPSPTAWTSVWL